MGAIHMEYGMNATELAAQLGRKTDAIRKRWNIVFPGRKFSATERLTAQDVAVLSGKTEIRKGIERVEKAVKIVKHQPTPAVSNEVPPGKNWKLPKVNVERIGLYTLMVIPAIASVQNMYGVTGHLTESAFASLVLTALFSASPFLFVIVGAKSAASKVLVVLMIGYECFCNTMRIYGGLTRFGIDGYPTRFLGLVTDFFDSGTYQTARVLAVFMAALAAGIFYAAYWQLNKK